MRAGGFLVSLLLLAGFYFAGTAIISVKFLELKIGLQRDRILNLELSSKALQRKSASIMLAESRPVSEELNEIVLESNFLNSAEADTTRLTWKHRVALILMNTVRIISLKKPIYLSGDREVMIMLRYGYLLERKRNYEEASEVYRVLETKSNDPDIEGFALLHRGYCLFASGHSEKAKKLLILLEKKYPVTHYAQAGRVLLNLLEQQQKKDEQIKKRYGNDRLKYARAAAKSGLCSESLQAYNDIRNRSPDDALFIAGCLEKTGETERAKEVYEELAEEGKSEAAKKANRRLLMISTFYRPSEADSQKAKERAAELGDEQTIELVSEAKKKENKPVVEKEIRELKEKDSAMLQELSTNHVTLPDPELPEKLPEKQEENEEAEEAETEEIRKPPVARPVIVQPRIPKPIHMDAYRITRPGFTVNRGTLTVNEDTYTSLVQTSAGTFLTGADTIEIDEKTVIVSSTGMLEIRLRGQKRAVYSSRLVLLPDEQSFQLADGKVYPLTLLYRINGI